MSAAANLRGKVRRRAGPPRVTDTCGRQLGVEGGDGVTRDRVNSALAHAVRCVCVCAFACQCVCARVCGQACGSAAVSATTSSDRQQSPRSRSAQPEPRRATMTTMTQQQEEEKQEQSRETPAAVPWDRGPKARYGVQRWPRAYDPSSPRGGRASRERGGGANAGASGPRCV
eukprot:2834318-Rhodomonas_salina.2